MKKYLNNLVFAMFLLLSSINIFYAQPPVPPKPGGDGPESAASPIDGYLIALIVVAISMVVYFVRKKQSKVA